MSIARKAGRAAGALFLRKCWTSLVSLGVIAYLASVLSKEEFGVVAFSSTILAVIQILAVSGISEYVVFFNGTENERAEVANAAFWLNLAASLGVVMVGAALAPAIARYFGQPVIGPVILVMLGGFFASMIASIPKALYRKDINYAPLVALETVQQTVVSIGQVLLAWQGWGVFSLVVPPTVVGSMIAAVFLWRSPLALTRGSGVHLWPSILRYSKHIVGARLLTRFANEGDNLVIGAVLGLSALGRYHLAYRMANILFLSLMPVVIDVSMPVFANIANERRRLFVRYVRMLSLIMFVMFPLLLMLFVNAREISLVIYHEDLGLLVQVLMISVLGRCISSPTGGLFNATGKPYVSLWFVCIFTPLFLGTLYLTCSQGLLVAASTVAAFFTVGQVVQTWLASRFVFRMPLGRILTRIWPYALPAGTASGLALFARTLVTSESLILHIVTISTVFLASYAVLFRTLAGKEVGRIIRLFGSIHPNLGQIARLLSWPDTTRFAN